MSARENDRRNPFWRESAECRNHDPEIWFPQLSAGSASAYDPKVRAAQAICASCMVQRECAREALEGDWRHGVWGGVYVSPSSEVRDAARGKLRSVAGVAS